MTYPFSFSDSEISAYGDGDALVRDDVLSRAAVTALVQTMDALDATDGFVPAGLGRDRAVDPRVRGDRTAWVAEDDEPGLRAEFTALREALNSSAWLGLALFTIQLAIYDAEGALYACHRDALADDPSRRTTAILYLNNDWIPAHGGCLRVHPPAGVRDVEPVGGRLVVFRSDRLSHEVLPSFAKRRAATAWFTGRTGSGLVDLAGRRG